jgi:hypothetical protein
MGEDAFSTTVTLTRGTGSRDKDKIKVEVSAMTVEELDDRVNALRKRMESWAADLRDVQPEEARKMPDDQTELGAVES